MKIVTLAIVLAGVAAFAIADDLPPKGSIPLGNHYFKSDKEVWVLGRAERLLDRSGRLNPFGSVTTYQKLRDVDARRFSLLDDDYATDERHVWCARAEPIAEISEVKRLGSGFFSVKNMVQKGCSQVFLSDNGKITPLMVASVQTIGCGIVKAESHLYSWASAHPFSDRVAGFALEPHATLDPASFAITAGGLRCSASDSRRVYQFSEDGRIVDLRPLPGHGSVFAEYSVSDGVVYWHASALRDVDPATFRAPAPGCAGDYGLDAHHVYHADHVLEGADAATFSCFSGTEYAKDSLHGYAFGNPIAGSDGATFELVPEPLGCQERFARDARHVYRRAETWPVAHPKTFERTAFIRRKEQPQCSASTFRDSEHIYYQSSAMKVWIIEGADPKSYVELEYGYSYDRDHAYRFGRPLEDKDKSEFEALRAGAAAAKPH